MNKLRVIGGKGEEIPAGKIICVGKNYLAHAREMKGIIPKEPVLFLKPRSSLIGDGKDIILPEMSKLVHHEVEIAVIIGRKGKRINEGEAANHIMGYALFLDITARDLQKEAKKKGLPWTISKGFDTFSVISYIVPKKRIPDPQDIRFTLHINGELRQSGHTRDMIFPITKLIAYISEIMTLEPGDIIATGTPEGVSAVTAGDVLESNMTGLISMTNHVIREQRF